MVLFTFTVFNNKLSQQTVSKKCRFGIWDELVSWKTSSAYKSERLHDPAVGRRAD